MGNDDEDEDSISSCLFKENTQISTFCANVKDGKPLKRLSTQRLKTIKKKFRQRKDNLHNSFDLMSSPHRRKLKFHDSCISTYNSKDHIARDAKRKKSESGEPSVKRSRRSDAKETFI